MNSNLKYNLLKNLSAKRAKGGFTLIELLVVVIIVGILAAVALPSLLGQIGKARETEGKNGVGTINRAAQALHFEAQSFATVDGLDDGDIADATNALGVTVESDYYNFAVITADLEDFEVTGDPINGVNDGVRSCGGGVSFNTGVYTNAVCQSNAIDAGVPTTGQINPPTPM